MNTELRIQNNEVEHTIRNSTFSVQYSLLFLILIISSCSNPYKNLTTTELSTSNIKTIPYALPHIEKTLIYKTNISFYKNDISGLLIIKRIEDDNYRIALTTQFGLKIFDFELKDGILNVKYCIEYLNKKAIINTFQTDFNLLLIQNEPDLIQFFSLADQNQNIWQFTSGKIKRYYIENTKSEKIENMSYKKRNSEKISVGLYNYKGEIPGEIKLEHKNIKLKMNLKLIQ